MDDIRIQKIRADAGNGQIRNLLDYLRDAPGPIYTSRTLPKEPNPAFQEVIDAIAALGCRSEGQWIEKYNCSERDYLHGVRRWLQAERDLQEEGGYEGLVEYPLETVMRETRGLPYFTSTPAYALALALAGKAGGLPEDVTSIAPFGIDFSHINAIKAEVGRACCEFWLGRCYEKGIDLKMPEDTWLLGTSTKSNLYGYDTRTARFELDGTIQFKDKPAPTAAEIEAAYSHAEKGKLWLMQSIRFSSRR
jgi:hypothetical protein